LRFELDGGVKQSLEIARVLGAVLSQGAAADETAADQAEAEEPAAEEREMEEPEEA
jgi:hypothetical protein